MAIAKINVNNNKKIKRYGAAVIVMAFDEVGQADTYDRRIEICKRSYDILVNEINFPAEDIIFDPNIFPVGTGIEEHKNNALDFFRATKWIKENLPGAMVSGGVSNVSFSLNMVANRADVLEKDGTVASKHVDVRFPIGPKKLNQEKSVAKKYEIEIK